MHPKWEPRQSPAVLPPLSPTIPPSCHVAESRRSPKIKGMKLMWTSCQVGRPSRHGSRVSWMTSSSDLLGWRESESHHLPCTCRSDGYTFSIASAFTCRSNGQHFRTDDFVYVYGPTIYIVRIPLPAIMCSTPLLSITIINNFIFVFFKLKKLNLRYK